MIKKIILSTAIICFALTAVCQTTLVTDSTKQTGTTVVKAGEDYWRNGWHHFWWGEHYRKEWNTPVRVPDFYLDTAKGGLEILEEGGSRQTSSLRLKAKDEHEYVLRSINKDFGRGLPDIYQGSFPAKVAKDQASIGYPYAAPVIKHLIGATSVYHTNPIIVFVPKQKALGEHNEKYGDQLYLFEERPDEDWSEAAFFGNSKNIIGSEKLLENIYEDNDNMVDAKAYARARLFDMFIGDWGRHEDQWRWAKIDSADKNIYRPIPRDRDQAFTNFDGFFPSLATAVTHLESFRDNIKNIEDYNFPAHDFDRHFLIYLSRQDWIDASTELKNALTDMVIESAVKTLPTEIFNLNGEKLITTLKARRDNLEDFGTRYYQYLSKHLTIQGTDKNELFSFTPIDANTTRLSVYKINKEKIKEEPPLYTRDIKLDETKEIRIWSHKGDDVLENNSENLRLPRLRIMAMSKDDKLNVANTKTVKVYKRDPAAYDTIFQKKLDVGPFFLLRPDHFKYFKHDPANFFPPPGLGIGAHISFIPNPWLKDSLEMKNDFSISYQPFRSGMYADYVGRIPAVIGKLDFVMKARKDFPAANNFFGVGNNSVNDQPNKYYNTRSSRFYASVGFNTPLEQVHEFMISAFYQDAKVNVKDKADPGNIKGYESLLTKQKFYGVEGGYHLRKVNDDLIPSKGIDYILGGAYVNPMNTDPSFFKLHSVFAFYFPLAPGLILASRAGGEHVTEPANYYHLAQLNGSQTLRGFLRERFYAQSAFFNNNELRWLFNTRNPIFNGKMGFNFFFDNGRVWQKGEVSDNWHKTFGGGLIFVPFNKGVLSVAYGQSKEGGRLLFEGGFFF